MTTPEARQEARRRWGSEGWTRCPDGLFTVGCGSIAVGPARSWDEAFMMADRDAGIAGYAVTQKMCDKAVKHD
jgi:hypothetical protein